MAGSIGLISGFLVADGSMIKAYNDSFDKYNIEDGHFRLNDSLSKENKKALEKEDVTIYNLNYIEEEVGSSSTIRLFKPRNKVNQVCIMDGKLPQSKNEIAIDRMYADNNNYQVGQTIKVGKKKLKITGLVALSDYSALFSKNSDLMFDAIKFGVGIVSDEGFESFKDAKIYYNYAWTYNEKVDNEVNASNDFLNVLVKNVSGIDDYIPQYANQAIHFTGDDMGGDEAMMTVLLYIIIGILAFVFAITTKNTIESEAPMIGTLRAMGYTKKEMLVQYMTLPILVSLGACIVGNILGYTYFKDVMAGMYYGSYSLPTYVTIWSGDAFIKTTIIPFIMMVLINYGILMKSLKLSPLKFMKRDIKKAKKNKKTLVLHRLGFFSQFRLSVILNNLSGYVTLFVGVLFAIILLMFGMDMHPVLDHYQDVADKYNLKKGDRISLKESYKDLRYTFEIKGIYDAPGSMALYMSKSYFNEVFNCQDGYFNGYFSNRKITDLKDDYIASTITQDDLTKVSRQLNVSMGEMFYLVEGFAIVMFIMLIYLLTKMIIENNKVSISMVKILGYTSKEIQKMYIHATTIVILISTLLSFGITTWILSYAFKIVFEEYAGWLPFYVEGSVYIKMFIMTVISYLFVMMIQMRKIKKIPMDEALKNVE